MTFVEALREILNGKKYTCPELLTTSGDVFKYLYVKDGVLTYSSGKEYKSPNVEVTESTKWTEYNDYPLIKDDLKNGQKVVIDSNLDTMYTVVTDVYSGEKKLLSAQANYVYNVPSNGRFKLAPL